MTTNLLLVAAFVAVMILMSMNFTKQKKKILFFGDSITEQGLKPGGYISLLQSFLNHEDLSSKYDLVGSGIGGDRIHDLYLRLEQDVLAKNLDTVVMLIGVNDVWNNEQKNTSIPEEGFAGFYEQVVQKIMDAGMKLIVCTPAVIGEKTGGMNLLDNELDACCDIIRNLAVKYHLTLVDLRLAFIKFNAEYNFENSYQGILTTDGVHLNERGNELVAEEIWAKLRERIVF